MPAPDTDRPQGPRAENAGLLRVVSLHRRLRAAGRDAWAERLRPRAEEARARLLQINEHIVWQAAQSHGLGLPLQDRVAAGMLGLDGAIRRFDPRRGRSLFRYALPRVLRHIHRECARMAFPVSVPARRVEMRRGSGSGPPPGRVDPSLVERAWDHAAALPLPHDGPGEAGAVSRAEMEAFAYSDQSSTPLTDEIGADVLRAAMARLRPRSRGILRRRFGFDGEPQTVIQVGGALGVSKQAVSYDEIRSIGRLRELLSRRHSLGRSPAAPAPGPEAVDWGPNEMGGGACRRLATRTR